MENTRRFTLTDLLMICGILCILSCMLLPQILAEPDTHGKNAGRKTDINPFTTKVIQVRMPTAGHDGRVNLSAYNDSDRPIESVTAVYATLEPVVVDHVTGSKPATVLSTSTMSFAATFHNLPPRAWSSLTVDYHLAPIKIIETPADAGSVDDRRR